MSPVRALNWRQAIHKTAKDIMRTLLLIDDVPNIHFTVEQVFADEAIRVFSAATAEEGLKLAARELPEVVLLDVRLGNTSGLELFEKLRQIDERVLIIFITGHGSADIAIEAMKLGAFEYLVKPLDFDRLRDVVHQAFEISRLMRVPAVVDEGSSLEPAERMIGNGVAMQFVCKQIGRVAAQDVNVLILGESGTGKELVARALYQHSRRSSKPFLAINCGAIAESLLESELFGHERGAFTGADRKRIGKFEQCDGGTLFLDEAGDMPLATQVKLLRVLQDGTFERVGGNETLKVNVRVIAATNQNLDALIERGAFRRDLFYRLKGVSVHLPPLRERSDDIAELAHYFLFRLNRQVGTTVQSIAPETLELLQRYPWPGNIRELQSVLREALIAAAGSVLMPQFLPPDLHQVSLPEADSVSVPAVRPNDWQELGAFVETAIARHEADVYRRSIERFDKQILSRALAQTNGHQANAATLIGVSRPTFRSKLRALGLSVEKNLTASVALNEIAPSGDNPSIDGNE